MSSVVLIQIALIAAALLVAFRKGGSPERLAAAVIAAWMVVDVSYHLLFGPSGFDRVDPVHLVLDGGVLIAITAIALRANRIWPLWAAAAQLICVTGHLAIVVQPEGLRRAYWAMTQIPPFIQLAALLLGVLAHSRRQKRWGNYRSWRRA
ncbi:MAG TPA: hypothetical protein VNR60_09475 [Croceibacterium sp.]|nr:hypothetical protein [Croceibacterium sp.]